MENTLESLIIKKKCLKLCNKIILKTSMKFFINKNKFVHNLKLVIKILIYYFINKKLTK